MAKAITKKQVQEVQSDKLKMIDIRSKEEYEKQHIPGVIHIPSEDLAKELVKFNEEDTIVCVCNYGKERSQRAADFLNNTGFTNTFYLEGGTSGWDE